MRKTLSLVLLCIASYSHAQFKSLFPGSSSFTDSLSMIVNDARHNYYSIQGSALDNEPDRESYTSRISLPGSVHCIIYRYHSVQDSTASWHGLMYKGEDYKQAAKVYRNTFQSVKRSKFLVEGKPITFKGDLDEPVESLRFKASTLRTNLEGKAYADFIAEVEMVNSYEGWEVRLNLQRRKDDDQKY